MALRAPADPCPCTSRNRSPAFGEHALEPPMRHQCATPGRVGESHLTASPESSVRCRHRKGLGLECATESRRIALHLSIDRRRRTCESISSHRRSQLNRARGPWAGDAGSPAGLASARYRSHAPQYARTRDMRSRSLDIAPCSHPSTGPSFGRDLWPGSDLNRPAARACGGPRNRAVHRPRPRSSSPRAGGAAAGRGVGIAVFRRQYGHSSIVTTARHQGPSGAHPR